MWKLEGRAEKSSGGKFSGLQFCKSVSYYNYDYNDGDADSGGGTAPRPAAVCGPMRHCG